MLVQGGAILLVVLNLILSILEGRRASKPARDRAKNETDYDRDISHNAQAAATGDAATLTLDFEAERQAAIRRGDLEPAPPGGREGRDARD